MPEIGRAREIADRHGDLLLICLEFGIARIFSRRQSLRVRDPRKVTDRGVNLHDRFGLTVDGRKPGVDLGARAGARVRRRVFL